MSARRKKAKAWYGWALIVNGRRDPNLIFKSRCRAAEWARPDDFNCITRVEIKEITPRKLRKHSDTR